MPALHVTPSAAYVVLVVGDPVREAAASDGDFRDMIRRAAGDAWRGVFTAIDARGDAGTPVVSALRGLIVTGSPARLGDAEPWMERAQEFILNAVVAGVPTFGICFGHQLLGAALGGRVAPNPLGREIGTVPLTVVATDSVVLPRSERGLVNASHLDSVVELPRDAVRLARTELEPNAAVRFAERAWGVQFHPEFTASIVRQYVSARADALETEGLDPRRIADAARDAPLGVATLRGFLQSLPH